MEIKKSNKTTTTNPVPPLVYLESLILHRLEEIDAQLAEISPMIEELQDEYNSLSTMLEKFKQKQTGNTPDIAHARTNITKAESITIPPPPVPPPTIQTSSKPQEILASSSSPFSPGVNVDNIINNLQSRMAQSNFLPHESPLDMGLYFLGSKKD